MEQYDYYMNIRHTDYRIVIPSSRKLPNQLKAAEWKVKETRPKDRVHGEIMNDINRQGFGAYQQDLKISDIKV